MNTILNVRGMTCGQCVKHVTDALRAVPGVTQVEVTLREGRAQIEHDATITSLIAAVKAEGYDASER
ncbi:MAG TPA: heavy metal-associated domain-containing protein [Polyangiales bacterium]|nr:heavy metal-associated domain-containing protein [Polyangiales bacterium]